MKILSNKKIIAIVMATSMLWSGTACSQKINKGGGYLSTVPETLAPSAGYTKEDFFGDRTYRLYTPNSATQNSKSPLLVVLHGGLGNAEFIEKALSMNPVADQYGFKVAYLNGTEGRVRFMKDKRTWNAGKCCGIAAKKRINDVSYIAGVIDDLIARQDVDPARVYLMGHSNGAMMSYRFACERPRMVAAVVTVSGPLAAQKCATARGVKILHVHGKKDNHVPVSGGDGRKSLTGVNYRSVMQTRSELENAGASVEELLVDGAGHKISEVDAAIQRYYSLSLAQRAARFFNGKARQF